MKVIASRPAGARGLKQLNITATGELKVVAPRRGAWIETQLSNSAMFSVIVAPRRGAWIETFTWDSIAKRGYVAPRRGAWIETSMP